MGANLNAGMQPRRSSNGTPYLAAGLVPARRYATRPAAPVFNPTYTKVGTSHNYCFINGDHGSDPNNSALFIQYSSPSGGR